MIKIAGQGKLPDQLLLPCPRARITCTLRLDIVPRKKDLAKELSSTLHSVHSDQRQHDNLLYLRIRSIYSIEEKIQRNVTGVWHCTEVSSYPGRSSKQN